MTARVSSIALRLMTIVIGTVVLAWIEGGAMRVLLQATAQQPLSVTPATVGSKPPGVQGMGLADVATVALVLHANSCPQCEDNYPAYKRIIQSCANKPPRTKVVVLSLEPPRDMQRVLTAAQLHPDTVFSFPTMHKIEVRSVPALIVFDKSGTIIRSFDGPLEPDQEQDVTSLCSTKSKQGPIGGDK